MTLSETTFRDHVRRLQLGDSVVCQGITFWPLSAHGSGRGHAPTLAADALAAGDLLVEETDRVTSLSVRNRSERIVLFLEGQIVAGGRQNRVINTTFAVPGKSAVQAPTSCVERGRWGGRSRQFRASESSVSSRVRAKLKRSVSSSTVISGGLRRHSDQAAVWQETRRTLAACGASSPADDHVAAFAARRVERERALAELREQLLGGGLVGVLAAYPDGSAFLETFAPALAERCLDRVLSSHLLYCFAEGALAPPPARPRLERLEGARLFTTPGVGGVGSELRLLQPSVSGSGFLLDGEVLHLSVDWARPKVIPPKRSAPDERSNPRGLRHSDLQAAQELRARLMPSLRAAAGQHAGDPRAADRLCDAVFSELLSELLREGPMSLGDAERAARIRLRRRILSWRREGS